MCIFINYTLRILKTLVDNLGVRVAKLEKNADNVKITGNIRAAYRSYSGSAGDKKDPSGSLRSRIYLTGEVNDNWHYVGMLQNEQLFAGEANTRNGESSTTFQRAYLDGNIGSLKLTAGRYNDSILDGDIYSHRVDGIKASVGKDVKFTAAYGKMSSDDNILGKATDDSSVAGKYWRAQVNGNVGKIGLEANYVVASDVKDQVIDDTKQDSKIWTLGAKYAANNWTLGATYLKGNNDYADSKDYSSNGYIFGFTVGGAKAAKPGTVGFWAKYYSMPAATSLSNGFDLAITNERTNGYKGYGVGVDYTVAKNMVASVEYGDFKNKDGNDENSKTKTLWSQLVVTF